MAMNDSEILKAVESYNLLNAQFLKIMKINKYDYAQNRLYGDFLAQGIKIYNGEMFMAVKNSMKAVGKLKQLYLNFEDRVDNKFIFPSQYVFFRGVSKWNDEEITSINNISDASECEGVKIDWGKNSMRFFVCTNRQASLNRPILIFIEESISYPPTYQSILDILFEFEKASALSKIKNCFPRGLTLFVKINDEKKTAIDSDLDFLRNYFAIEQCKNRMQPISFDVKIMLEEDFENFKHCVS